MRSLAAAAAVALSLLAPATAGAAEQLLETLTVDPDSRSVMSGTVTLKKGTRYVIEVTGTMQSTGNGGFGYKFDALYCYAGVGFDHEECEDERRDPANQTQRQSNWWLSAGPGEDWRLPDQFTTTSKPVGDTPVVAYDANHAYSMGFYPPADGPIKAVGDYGRFPDPNEQNTTTGSFTVKVFGEGPTPHPVAVAVALDDADGTCLRERRRGPRQERAIGQSTCSGNCRQLGSPGSWGSATRPSRSTSAASRSRPTSSRSSSTPGSRIPRASS